jgi:endonuclease/exonuclease/phosphatase family metal-dependent hydrolase
MKTVLIVLSTLFLFISSSFQPKPVGPRYRVFTYNIRYANKADGVNSWENRRALVTAQILLYYPQIVGLQEVLSSQLADLKKAMPDYTFIGVGRDDGKEGGEFSPIAFDKAQGRNLIDWKTIWLSPTPNKPSKGWDAALPRIATLARLKMINGDTLTVINTHFDHQGEKARLESAKLILSLLPAKNYIVMGDLNATSDEAPVMELLNSGKFATPRPIPYTTCCGFKKRPDSEGKTIDYILYPSTATLFKQYADSTTKNGYYGSDHLPVYSVIGF